MNKTHFKYGATIVVIVEGNQTSGGLYFSGVPEQLSKINKLGDVDKQWEELMDARDNHGGIYFTTTNLKSAFRELLDDFIDKDGFMREDGMKIVHTREHGDFCVRLVWLTGREDFIEESLGFGL